MGACCRPLHAPGCWLAVLGGLYLVAASPPSLPSSSHDVLLGFFLAVPGLRYSMRDLTEKDHDVGQVEGRRRRGR